MRSKTWAAMLQPKAKPSWFVRRLARDSVTRAREEFISAGTGQFTLNANGDIKIVSITSDGTPIDPETAASLQVNTLILDPNDVPDQSIVVVTYDNSAYTNAEIEAFLADAASIVGADLGIMWLVIEEDGSWRITSIPDSEIDTVGSTQVLNATIVKLIALRGGIGTYQDKANRRADQAIMVRDGTTTIDTSKAASTGTRTLFNMETDYQVALKYALSRRFKGHSS
jgi:hypothetical protein